MKGARTVPTGGKSARIYLSGLGRGIYYGSYRSPRTLVWALGVIIFVLLVATAFMGWGPKWFNINNKGNRIKYNKINKLFNQSIVKRGYCTSRPSDNFEISSRLKTIIQELGLDPVCIYENLNLEDTRKQILNDTRGLSGIYNDVGNHWDANIYQIPGKP